MHFSEYASPIGKLLLCSDGAHLTGAWFDRALPEPAQEDEVLKAAEKWLDSYFRGEFREPEIPLLPEGTVFQKQVWRLLQEIPWGEVTSYGYLARQISEKMAPQAVGQAVGKNPLAIFIPCHRCIGADGKLTGYAWGTEKKQWLLEHEQKGRA